MQDHETVSECTSDVLVNFAESLHIFTGLLTVATVFGGLAGIIATAVLYKYCFKPMVLSRQGYCARRLFEASGMEAENNQCDCVRNCKREVQSGTTLANDKKQQPINSDVAAFASRAKVVYPINQRYRPLADGASNPSLPEDSMLPVLSSSETLSQLQDNEDSSQYIYSSLIPKSLENESFTRVSHYPHTLCQTGFEGRISLYCLALQDVQRLCSNVQEDKSVIFLQTLKILLFGRFPKDKKDSTFSTDVLVTQEKAMGDLNKQLPTSLFACDLKAATPCTLDEIERAQKDLQEHGLQMTKGFSKQVEALCQLLLGPTSVLPCDEAQVIIQAIIHSLLLVENHLTETQEAELRRTQERLLWWEELTGTLQSQPALLKQEVSTRQDLLARALEELTSDGQLTFALMKKTLTELQSALSEGLQQYTHECWMKTKELVGEKCRKSNSKRKKLLRSLAKERVYVLDSLQKQSDPLEFGKAYLEMLERHRKLISELDLQQDVRVAETVCDLWKKLRLSWSKKLGKQAEEILFTALPNHSMLRPNQCKQLWFDVDKGLGAHLQQAEATIKVQLEMLSTRLNQEGQVWLKESAVVLTCLRQLGEQQMKTLQDVLLRQSHTLDSQVGLLIEKKEHLLLAVVQNHFAARHFSLRVLREMRLSKLKVLSQSDFRALNLEECDTGQPSVKPLSKEGSLAEHHLDPESQLVTHTFQQEFLSELETGAELLQSHAQMLVGHALSHSIWQLMETCSHSGEPQTNHGWKCHLIDVASESVYLTKASLSALVESYYSQLQDHTRGILQQQSSSFSLGECERRENSAQLVKVLLRELANWGCEPTCTEFQQRVVIQKKHVLEQHEQEQKAVCETLRRSKLALDISLEKVKGQLLEAEEAFVAKLAALARVPLDSKELISQGSNDSAGGEDLFLNLALNPELNTSLTPTVMAAPLKVQRRNRL